VIVFVAAGGKTRSIRPDEATKSVVHRRYGCFWLLGDRMYARRNEVLDTPAKARRWVNEIVLRFVKALEALEADGNVRRVGSVSVLSVYERPYVSRLLV